MAKIEIIKMGHAVVEGTRGEKGGAPSKDSVWGLAFVQGNLVKFYGRRNGKLRFKTEKKAELEAALALYAQKLAGKDVKGIVYTDIADTEAQLALCPNLLADVTGGFYKAMAHGKLNTNATKKVAKAAKVEKAVEAA